MKSALYFMGAMSIAFILVSCGSTKKLAKSPIETFNMPCVEFTSGEGTLRAWASGKSDNQMAARKKAQVAASAQLAAMLEQAVESTTKDLTTEIASDDTGIAKSLLNSAINIAIKQSLKGAAIICDKWTKDEATGQYTNYLVMELRGETYLESLYSELDKEADTSIDRKELERLFIKHINETK